MENVGRMLSVRTRSSKTCLQHWIRSFLFGQSNPERITDKMWEMTLDMFKETKRRSDNFSALDLRQVGYSPPLNFDPFVATGTKVVHMTTGKGTFEGFLWWVTGGLFQ